LLLGTPRHCRESQQPQFQGYIILYYKISIHARNKTEINPQIMYKFCHFGKNLAHVAAHIKNLSENIYSERFFVILRLKFAAY
jgi:hypothetical protein